MPASSTAKPTAVITLRERPPAPKAEEIGYPRASKADQAKAEKRKTSVPEMPQSPADIGLSSEVQVYVSGRNGIKYPAHLCTRTGRIRILDQDGVHPLQKAWDHLAWLPVGLLVRHAFLKAAATASAAPGTAQAGGGKPRLSKQELESMNLRWITIHPNGDDEEGQPVLVHDDGSHYTVVGGAGGKLNQLVMPHGEPKSAAEQKAASKERAAKREERQKQRQSEHPEEYGQYEEKREALKEALKERLGPLQKELSQEFGRNFSFENLHQMARAEALRENPNADEKEIQKVQKKAEGEVKKGLRDAAEQVVKDHMDQQSLRDMNVNIDKETKTSIKAKVLGQDFLAEITPERRAEIMNQIVGIDKLKREIRALDRAMRSGDTEAIRGIEVQMSERDPSPEEVEDWTRKGYLSNKEVLVQTALTKGALDASPVSQARYQAAGASDAANAIANEFTGYAIMDSDRARLLGPEGIARVTAAWLASQGVDLRGSGQKLEERHAQMSYAKGAAVIKQAVEMDEITDAAMAAAKRGDGTVEFSQAGNLSMQMQSKKAALFCSAQGNLRTNVVSHLLLTSGQLDDDMDVSGGKTFTESHKKAASLGLAKGDYKLQRKEGKVSIVVPAANVHKMALGVKIDDPERDTAFSQMENDVAANFDTKQWPGMKEGGNTPRPYQHQCLIAESLVRFKKMLVNAGAGSGKTRSYYMAASSLLHGGQIEKGIITMPLAPFSKQEDGIDPETGQGFVGERKKWCDDKTQGMFVSCGTTPELRKALERVQSGEKLVIVTTHNVFKRNVNALLAAGIGGPKSAVYGDEAQDLAMRGEKGSQRSRAFRDLTKNAEYACVSSGTLIERDAKELHSLSEMIHPGALPEVKKFQGEWQRAGRQDDPSQVARLRGLFAGRMVSYHKPVQRTVTDEVTGESRREGVPLLQKDESVHLHPAQNEAIADSNRARRAAIAPNANQIAAFQRRAARDWANQGKPQGANEDPADYRARQPRKNESEEQFVRRRAAQIENNARTSASMQHVMRSMQISTQGVWVDTEGKLLRENPTDVERAAGLPGKPMKDAAHIEGAQFVNPKMDRVKEITEEMRDRYAREYREGKRKDPHFKFGLYSTELAPIEAAKQKMNKLKWTQITGSEDADARRKAAIAINDRRANIRRPGADAVAFTSAGNYGWDGQGMDAQFISHVIPSPGKEGQIIARGYREGQERDFHAFRIFSDDFRERALGYRIQNENATQVDLLKKMDVSHAADGDDTPLASVIAANMDKILAVAGIDPEEAARRIIGKQRVQKAVAVVSVRKKKRPEVTFEAMEQGESAEKVRMKSVITVVRKASAPAKTLHVKGGPVHVYNSVHDFKRSEAIHPSHAGYEQHKTMLTSEGHVLHWRHMGLHHQQLEQAAKVKGAVFGAIVHNGGGRANKGTTYLRMDKMRPHAETRAFQAAHEETKAGRRVDPLRSRVAQARSDPKYQVPRGSLDKALRKALDPPETGKAPAGGPSSIETMNQRLKYEMARSAAKYDEHRKDLAGRSKQWQQELGDLNRTYKALRPKAEKAIEQGVTAGNARLLVEYMKVCHRRYRVALALQMASHATQKPGGQAIGRPVGQPVQQPLDPEYFGGGVDAQAQ
jgi:hypothetical protein